MINKFKNIDTFRTYLKKYSKEDIDTLICYDWGTLFDSDYHGGHVCLLDLIYIDKDEVRFIDPDYNSPKWRTVKIEKLYEAMKFHGKDNSGGFWEVTYTE